jgi:hypothetical protein
MKNIVFAVDEDTTLHWSIKASLEQIYGDEIEVIIDKPKPTIVEMIEHLVSIGDRLVALILDERLNDTGECNYLGSDFAEAFRDINSKIPMYILTSFGADDSGDIEYILTKDSLHQDLDALKQRLRRHVDIYKDIVGSRRVRLDKLVVLELQGNLTEEFQIELDELLYWRAKPIQLEEGFHTRQVRADLEKNDELLAEIEALLGKG